MLSLAIELQDNPDLVLGFAFELVDDSTDFHPIVLCPQLNVDTDPRFTGLWDDNHS